MVLEDIRKINIMQIKFRKTKNLIIGIIFVLASIVLGIVGFVQSRGELILFSLILLVIGILLVVLNKIGLNSIKRQGF